MRTHLLAGLATFIVSSAHAEFFNDVQEIQQYPNYFDEVQTGMARAVVYVKYCPHNPVTRKVLVNNGIVRQWFEQHEKEMVNELERLATKAEKDVPRWCSEQKPDIDHATQQMLRK